MFDPALPSDYLRRVAAFAQQEPPTQAPAAPERRDPSPEPRPYDRVITKEAKSDAGIFTVHRIGDRLFYEIPKAMLDKEFLWVSQIARTTLGVGWGGQAAGNRVVRWERRGNRILLRNVAYDVVADAAQPIAQAVKAANNDTILMAFNIETFGKDDAAVIDVTRLFTSEVPEFSVRSRIRSRQFDSNRSFVERAVSFPENIEVEATHTFTSPPELQNQQQQGPPTPQQAANAIRAGSASVVMHYSMVKLPEKPMMPRLFDERVGYFSARQMDYGQDEHRAPRAPLHHALAARQERSGGGDVRAGEADRLLRRSGDADEVGAVHQEGDRGVAAGVRGRGIQERDSRARGAERAAGSGLESRGRALFGDSLAAVDDRERVGAAHSRSAHRRDSRSRTSSSTTTS